MELKLFGKLWLMQKKGLIVIADAKRGDIGDTSKAYAEFKRR